MPPIKGRLQKCNMRPTANFRNTYTQFHTIKENFQSKALKNFRTKTLESLKSNLTVKVPFKHTDSSGTAR
jgi:hypothetical protein